MSPTEAVVAGAGPTGLTLALELARRGVEVRILDKSPEPFAGSRGKGLTARSQEVMDDLGIVDEIVEAGFRHLPSRVAVRGQVVRDSDPHADLSPTPDRPYDGGLMIPQWRTEQILRERLSEFGIDVERGVEVAGFEQTTDKVAVRLAGGGTVMARYLVGCDGGRSAVRKALGVSFEGTGGIEGMLLGDVSVDGLVPDRWYQWTHPERGFVALCPFRGINSWQFQGVPFADFDEEGNLPEPSLEYFQRVLDDIACGPGVRLSEPTWLSTWHVNVRMVDRFRDGRVFLAGDAAHVHPPSGGLGMNTGIQDAYNLGWKLALVLAGSADPSLLDTYQEERLPLARWTLGVSSAGLQKVASNLGREDSEGFAGAVTEDGQQLGLGYPWSSLSRDGDVTTGLRAGDRAPDAPCLSPDGTPLRLFDVFRGTHFTVLGFGGGSRHILQTLAEDAPDDVTYVVVGDSRGPGVDVVDDRGLARSAYGAHGGTLVVVRPDGYVALTAAATAADGVIDYLGRLVGRSS